MRRIRVAVFGMVFALPAGLAIPGAVAVQASAPSCSGLPPVSSFSVYFGSTHGGSGITLNQSTSIGGPSFSSGGTVYFSDASGNPSSGVSASFGGSSSNSIGVAAPAGARSGPVDLCLSNDNQLYQVSGGYVYTFNPSVSSTTSSGSEGSNVTVNGNFYNRSFSAAVGSCAVTPHMVNEGQFTFSAPGPADACSGSVSVSETAADGTVLHGAGGDFAVTPTTPSVTCGNPCSPGQTITVQGSGYGNSGSWSFGPAGGKTGDTGFSFAAPDTDSATLQIAAPYGSVAAASATAILPHISGVTPPNATEGSNVEVDGQAFGGNRGSITVAGQAVQVTGWGMDKATFTMPGAAGDVALTSDSGASVNTVHLGLLPTISGVSPSSAKAGDLVTISGSGFGQTATVTIGGKSAQVALPGDNEMAVIVPSGAQSGKVVVTNGYGQSASWSGTFTVLAGTSPNAASNSGSFGSGTTGGNIYIKPNYGFLPLPKPPPTVGFHVTAPSVDVKPGATVPLTVTLQLLNKPVAGSTVTLQIFKSPGSDASLSAPSGVTDANGQLIVQLKTSKKPGQTIVIARSGAFGDEITITATAPAAAGGLSRTLITNATLDPHVLVPFVGALIVAVLLLLGAVVLQWRLHRRAAVAVPAAVEATVAGAPQSASEQAPPKPRRPRTRKPKEPVAPEAVAEVPEVLAEAVGAEGMAIDAAPEAIAPVIPLRKPRAAKAVQAQQARRRTPRTPKAKE